MAYTLNASQEKKELRTETMHIFGRMLTRTFAINDTGALPMPQGLAKTVFYKSLAPFLKQGGYRCSDGSATCSQPEEMQKIQAICTRSCETSDDCAVSADNVNGCQTFACQRSRPSHGDPPVPCYCVCLDYIRGDEGETPKFYVRVLRHELGLGIFPALKRPGAS